MIWLQWLIVFASFSLQILVVASLLRRGVYKLYPFVFVYSLVLFLTILTEVPVFAGIVKLSKDSWLYYFYRNEAIRQFVLFAAVVSLIERAMFARPYLWRVRVLLALTGVICVLVSVVIHSDSPYPGLWMTEVTRDLSFGSVVLTLLLWSMLISTKRKDHQLLMITAGLGLQFTGEAIGNALRQMSQHRPVVLLTGNILLGASHLMRLYVWLEAFRKPQTLPDKADDAEEPGGKSKALPRQAETLFQPNE